MFSRGPAGTTYTSAQNLTDLDDSLPTCIHQPPMTPTGNHSPFLQGLTQVWIHENSLELSLTAIPSTESLWLSADSTSLLILGAHPELG